MGMGQNSVFLASHGYNVEGVDSSHSAVLLAGEAAGKRGVSLKAVEKNMLEYEIKENYFDIILNFYFLERSLIPGIHKGLKKNGIVFFETYTVDHADFSKPSNPDFLLKPNELLGFFLDFFIVFYYERTEETRAVASLIAQKV
jgi:2-polyprenyl-3-methyl-5-hydroxy-6-metoxy-1,4-benzoquinol methylase